MIHSEFNDFSEAWADAHEVMPAGKVLSSRAMESIFYDLENYPLQSILSAIKHHRKTARYAPAPKDIIDLLEAHNKRPAADEAWAMLPASEFETVVWTQEMAEAYASAYDLISSGDKIAARMAFKGAYERLCSESNMHGRGVKWSVCLGYDKAGIEPALLKAAAAGRITHAQARKYIPAPSESGPIAGLLTGKVTELPANNENLKKHWKGLGEALKAGQAKMAEKDRQRVIDTEEKHAEFERKKQDQIGMVENKLGRKLT